MGECGLTLSFDSFLNRFQHLETAHERLVDDHHSGRVIKFTTIIRRGENGNQLPLGEKLVAVLDDLMSAANEIQIVRSKE